MENYSVVWLTVTKTESYFRNPPFEHSERHAICIQIKIRNIVHHISFQSARSLWSEKVFSVTFNTTDKNLGRAAGRKSSSIQPSVLSNQNYTLHQINKQKYYFIECLTILDFTSSHRRHFCLIYVNKRYFLPFNYFTFKHDLQTKGHLTLLFFRFVNKF